MRKADSDRSTTPNPVRRRIRGIALLLGVALAGVAACESGPRQKPRAEARPLITRDIPAVLRNTIGSETTLRGAEPVLVSGYGLVVNLAGTGSNDVPIAVRVMVEQEMTRRGVGSHSPTSGVFRNMTPSEVIDDPGTAVVLVTALIEAGAPRGTKFDVRVDALPGTSTRSLEGGILYTCNLYRGMIRPGGPATQPIARANGPVFINPFVDPARASQTGVPQLTGRILNGGEVIDPFSLAMFMDNPSHSRARALVAAVNSRFPREHGQLQDTARGRSDELIEITVPPSYRDRAQDFIQLIRHTRIDQAFPQEWALRYVRAMREFPELSRSLSWCLKALGDVAVPQVRELYMYPEIGPRMAAIEAGAFLGDPLTRPALEDLVLNGPVAMREDALKMMARLGPDPRINRFLREQLNSPDLALRIAAYEGLEERRDPVVVRQVIGRKFVLDSVASDYPMIYVTQSKAPRIVLFGFGLQIERPVYASIWDNRMMIDAKSPDERLRIYYLDYRTNRRSTESIKPDLAEVIQFFAHMTTPEEPAPGLDLTYSEIVGALHDLLAQGAYRAAFVPERDRLALSALRQAQQTSIAERPELLDAEEAESGPDYLGILQDPVETPQAEPEKEPDPLRRPRRQYVVPVEPLNSGTGSGSRDR